MTDEIHGSHPQVQHQQMFDILQGTSRNMSIPIISGLCAQNKFLWPNAAPIEFTWELDDATANLFVPSHAVTKTDQWQIQNVYMIADAVEMDAGLLNKYVQHLAQGFSLSWEIKTLNSVLHSVGNSHASFSCNQSRAYTKLDTVFASLVRSVDVGTNLATCKKPVNWFQGLNAEHVGGIVPDNDTDILESYITLGSKRIPVFQKVELICTTSGCYRRVAKTLRTFITYLCLATLTYHAHSAWDTILKNCLLELWHPSPGKTPGRVTF